MVTFSGLPLHLHSTTPAWRLASNAFKHVRNAGRMTRATLLNRLAKIDPERLHVAVGVDERIHRFREVSGVPAIEAAAAELNMRLAARGARTRCLPLRVAIACCCSGDGALHRCTA